MKKWGIYEWSVITEFIFIPVITIITELIVTDNNITYIILKWFVISIIGLRLIGAGLKQIIFPSFTAKSIFKIDNNNAFAIVRELGFANVCIGISAIISIFSIYMLISVAFIGALYFGADATAHIIRHKQKDELFACISDIYACIMLLISGIIFII